MRKQLIFIIGALVLVYVFATQNISLAAVTTNIDLTQHSNLPTDIIQVLCDVADWVFKAALLFSVIAVLVSAFFYLSSGGNEQKITKGKKALNYVVVGIVVTLLAWGAASIIATALSGSGGTIADPCAKTSLAGSFAWLYAW